MLAALAVVAAVAGGVGATLSVTNDSAPVQEPAAVVEQAAPAPVHAEEGASRNPFLEVDGL